MGNIQSNGIEGWDFAPYCSYSALVHEFHLSAKIPGKRLLVLKKKKPSPKYYSQTATSP